ncbi:hypothetical protein [Rhodopila sp.]|uniref:hypothetical protein n=1 Tax=Rhodopila sp. TaxID=2480087 RepID=UPI003D0DE6CC
MSILHAALALSTNFNLHLCLYGAFGATLLHRSLLAIRDHRYDVARKDAVIGLVHILLAML